MSPEDRRASIIEAALPLVRVHGKDVTTRQIAAAAGVAEGTLFRVFDNKDEIVHAVVDSVIDPAPTLHRLAAIDVNREIDVLIADVVATMQQRLRAVIEIMMAVRWMPPEHLKNGRPQSWDNDPIMLRIIEMLDGHQDELSVVPEQAARILRLLVFAGTHPMINAGQALETDEIVNTLMDGIRNRGRPTDAPRRPNPPTAPARQPSAKSAAGRKPTAKSS